MFCSRNYLFKFIYIYFYLSYALNLSFVNFCLIFFLSHVLCKIRQMSFFTCSCKQRIFKNRFSFSLNYSFILHIRSSLLTWVAIARERKRNDRGKGRRRSREAGARPLMFESHRPPACVFAFLWKCRYAK